MVLILRYENSEAMTPNTIIAVPKADDQGALYKEIGRLKDKLWDAAIDDDEIYNITDSQLLDRLGYEHTVIRNYLVSDPYNGYSQQ